MATLLVLIGFFLGISRLQSENAQLSITVVPASSIVLLNNTRIGQGVHNVRPGTYTVKATLSGFASRQETVRLSTQDVTKVSLILLPDSPSTANWYTTHPADETAEESLSSQQNDTLTNQTIKNDPLVEKLPQVGPGLEYRIDYLVSSPQTETHPIIQITANSPKARMDALSWIQNEGFDVTNYDIQFINQEPL